MRRPFVWLAGILAGAINFWLLRYLVWNALNPHGIFGRVRERFDFASMIMALVPLANLIAILLRILGPPRTQALIKVIRGFNVFLVVGALVFGVASAVESSFSGFEQLGTLLLLLPPAATVLALHSPKQIVVARPS